MLSALIICLASVFCLMFILRRDRCSLGLPFAYLFSLLLIHVPGALAHLVGSHLLPYSEPTEISMNFTAIGCVSFVSAVYLVHLVGKKSRKGIACDHTRFSVYCLFAGWF